MADETDRIRTQIRLPADLYEAVKSFADERGQSLNEAMVRLMRAGLTADEEEMQVDRLAELERRMERLEETLKRLEK